MWSFMQSSILAAESYMCGVLAKFESRCAHGTSMLFHVPFHQSTQRAFLVATSWATSYHIPAEPAADRVHFLSWPLCLRMCVPFQSDLFKPHNTCILPERGVTDYPFSSVPSRKLLAGPPMYTATASQVLPLPEDCKFQPRL